MSSLVCIFRPCRWWHVANLDDDTGLYQCWRCKTMSIGSTRPFEVPTDPSEDDMLSGMAQPTSVPGPGYHPNGAGGFDPVAHSYRRTTGDANPNHGPTVENQSIAEQQEAAARADIARLQRHMNPPGL